MTDKDHKLNRRSFIKKAGATTIGLPLVGDPFIKAFAEDNQLDPETLSREITFDCQVLREKDFSYLHFYFFNLKASRRFAKDIDHIRGGSDELLKFDPSIHYRDDKLASRPSSMLKKIDVGAPAYFIVRLPQQHITEEAFEQNDPTKLYDTVAKSYISGYSYLTFRLKHGKTKISLREKQLLNWDNYDLVNQNELIDNYETTNLDGGSAYPITYPEKLSQLPSSILNEHRLPPSMLELPLGMYLSPAAPEEKDVSDFSYFVKNNQTRDLDRAIGNDLFELSSIDLKLRSLRKTERGEEVFEGPPEFKVLAYSQLDKDNYDNSTLLLPNPRVDDRGKIARSTYLENSSGPRNVRSKGFRLSTLGATTQLTYENRNSVKGSVVAWYQYVRQGRDNYVEIKLDGVDCRTGLKVIISRITERVLRDGITYLQFRYFIEPKEFEKTYPGNEYAALPFKKIIANYKGVFFTPADPKILKPTDNAHSDCNKSHINSYFHLFKEYGEDVEDLLKLDYIGIDHEGNEVPFKLDAFVIMEDCFTATTAKSAQTLALKNIEKESQFITQFSGQKIAFLEAALLEGLGQSNDGKVKNNTLPVIDARFYFDLDNSYAFRSDNPVKPRLLYAKAGVPQLEGILPAEPIKTVSYSPEYVSRRNDNKLIANSDDDEKIWNGLYVNFVTSKVSAFKNSDRIKLNRDADDKITLIAPKDTIDKVFEENYKNSGGMINPGIKIDGISLRNQSLVFGESTPIYTDSDSKSKVGGVSVEYVKPKELLRSINAEIFGGVTLKDILSEFIPLDEAPIFDLIEDAEGAIGVIEEVKDDYESIVEEIKKTRSDIERLGKAYLGVVSNEVNDWIAQFVDIQIDVKHFNILQSRFCNISGNSKTPDCSELTIQAELNNVLIAEQDLLEASIRKAIPAEAKELGVSIKHIIDQYELGENGKVAQAYRDYYVTFNQLKSLASSIDKQRLEVYVKAYLRAELNRVFGDDYKILVQFLEEKGKALQGEAKIVFAEHKAAALELYGQAEDFVYSAEARLKEEGEVLDDRLKALEGVNEYVKKYLSLREVYLAFSYFQETYEKFVNTAKRLKQFGDELDIEVNPDCVFCTLKPDQIKKELSTQVNNYIDELIVAYVDDKEILDLINDYGDDFRKIEKKYRDHKRKFKRAEREIKGVIKEKQINFFKKLVEIEQKLEEAKKKVALLENDLKCFLSDKIDELEKEYSEETKNLVKAYKEGLATVEVVKNNVERLRLMLEKLKSIDRKTVSYQWKTKEFRDADLGFVKFAKKDSPPTTLALDNTNTVHFDLGDFSKPPSIKDYSYSTKGSLTNFDINFFSLINLSFSDVTFKAGNKVKDDFQVNISNIGFEGALNFVDSFRQYLKSLDKGLSLDIDADGVDIGYFFPIPDIKGGAFNFAFAKVMVGFHLPFKAGVPMTFTFGLNDPRDMFLISAGVFGGRGCFQLELDPKEGVRSVLLVMEYGGVILLDVGVADGIVYLFAGLYIKRGRDSYEVRGYVTVGGAMDVLGLITVSASYYIGVEGVGPTVYGVSTYRYTIKISAFFKVKAKVTVRKKIKGPAEKKDKSEFSLLSSGESEIDRKRWQAYFQSYS